ncbi:hypothetical protein I4I73_29015 [Pseudonocardia sp. KRD-184]|uniref:Uncharacterized protein n=1 Tax=Pseudonocardia oceani TaxID=2792013 RepID=A0ABS6UFZ4_9PSEU|nr:hypothetical protein [Pseudonocardia oceani]MBW0088212.1 hypothetical protein [Pseudonocardia oceani]MBW0100026.1 hypothetical protein [Pseudonocardia oceani]MBW0121153.1 hypothetical protein [Pseudonocardia oceani]MBW0131161.1 hypothetical protein [Pseudonocardia oceani]MBW0132577.1 hypothetical protein [Pseudonocardia oceani]
MNGPDTSEAQARLLLTAVCGLSMSERLDAMMEEVRVARLIAHMQPYLVSSVSERFDALVEEVRVARLITHMRPFLVSSRSAKTRPVVPSQRRASPDEKRLDDITAEARRREAAGRPATVAAYARRHRRYPPVP